jgi:hypothetical protein
MSYRCLAAARTDVYGRIFERRRESGDLHGYSFGTGLARSSLMDGLAHVLLGAALVLIGVLAAAVADRIRGVRVAGVRASRAGSASASAVVRPSSTRRTDVDARADDVVRALITAGYDKRVAAAATADCTPEQRATLEVWTRAALRRCAQEGAS